MVALRKNIEAISQAIHSRNLDLIIQKSKNLTASPKVK